MIYTVKIEGMEFRAAHGCCETERRVGGNFTVDIALDVEGRNTGGGNGAGGDVMADDLARTVNYVEVYELVRRQMAVPSHIIENAAWRIAEAVRERFPQVKRTEVVLAKLAPPIGGKAAKVSVTLVK